uniref:Uncharacterized protein n=1 Tax=Lepeophtheirus salmonis TaxID=72036 RepID=A0A0K2TFK2_LEPSM
MRGNGNGGGRRTIVECFKNPAVPPRRVMFDISNKLQNIHNNLTSSEGSIRRMIQRRRKRINGGLPSLPLSFEDVIQLMPQSLKETSTGVRLLLFADYISKDDVIFMSSLDKNYSNWSLRMAHGTFKTCLHPFKQI